MEIKHIALAVTAGAGLLIGASQVANADTVTVKAGDTLSSIAQDNGTDVKSLLDSNKLASENATIYEGQSINVDKQVDHKTYVVQAGDTLSKIADQFGTTIDKLASTNHIADVNSLSIGQKLIVDGTDAQPVAQTAQTPVESTPVTTANVVQSTPVQTLAAPQASVQPVSKPVAQHYSAPQAVNNHAGSGSTYDQFIANGGSAAMWNAIVMPESGGNPNASNGRYKGLFQGDTSYGWSNGDVATQTKGAINYANSRYGSVSGAVQFRQSHGWW